MSIAVDDILFVECVHKLPNIFTCFYAFRFYDYTHIKINTLHQHLLKSFQLQHRDTQPFIPESTQTRIQCLARLGKGNTQQEVPQTFPLQFFKLTFWWQVLAPLIVFKSCLFRQKFAWLLLLIPIKKSSFHMN